MLIAIDKRGSINLPATGNSPIHGASELFLLEIMYVKHYYPHT
jgi:hypothetical protein